MSSAQPSSHVFYRKLRRAYPTIVRASGCWLEDDAGRRYLDGSGGAFVVNIGHGVADIGDAMAAQAARVGYVNGTMFTHDPVEALAAEIARRSPGDLSYVYFLGSGSEAVEASLKLARQYWVERGKPNKHKVLALTPSYHGNTLLALSASAREQYRTLYRDWLVAIPRVPAPYPYRCPADATALARVLNSEGADTVAAFIAEPVGGSSTGASVPPPGYWQQIREICTAHDVLFIADEVLTGVGRTGTWSALEPYGVAPDIMTLGKGLGGGYAPLSAVVASARIVSAIADGSGAFQHAQTFSHHPVLCAGGLATLRYLDKHNLFARCARVAPRFHDALDALRELPYVGDVRGRGLLAGVEFVENKETRAPFPRAARFAERFAQAALDAGLVVWPNSGQADGVNGDIAMLAPPFIITDEEIDELVARFRTALCQLL
jgi:adenosylmethionine-8-amino-7-oxononanoate aminotransferase